MRRVEGFPLWIGTARDARDLRAVLDAEIEAVVDLAMEEPPIHPTRELNYFRIPLIDGGGNTPRQLELAFDVVSFLALQGAKTLVACGAGMSRSPAVVAVALSLAGNGSPSEWLERIASAGDTDVSPALWRALHDAMNWRASGPRPFP